MTSLYLCSYGVLNMKEMSLTSYLMTFIQPLLLLYILILNIPLSLQFTLEDL